MKIQVLRRDEFPSSVFFDHLLKGTEYYQDHIFGRAIEEWVAADKLKYLKPVYLKSIQGKKFFGSMLEEIPLLFFLYAIQANKITGIGILKRQGISKQLVFQEGLLVFAATSREKERIGNFVLRRENLAPAKLDELVRESKKQGKKLGMYLVEKGLLSPRRLRGLLAIQAEEILCNSFFWQKGHIYFVEKDLADEPVVHYTPLKIALLSAQREFNFTNFRKEIADNKVIFRYSPYLKEREEITKRLNINEQFIFSLINGTRNIDQLIKFGGANEVSVINIVYKLNSMGLIRKTKEVGEYEDEEFEEIVKILKVLFEVFRIITAELFNELGLEAKNIIQKARNHISPDYQMVFLNTSLYNPEKLSIDAILRNMASYFPSNDLKSVCIDAFRELFMNTLGELKGFLGMKLTNKTIKSIKKTKTDIETFSLDTGMRKRLVAILNEIIKEYG